MAKPLELVLAPSLPPVAEVFKAAARVQAGLDTTRVQIAEVPADAPAGKQAELVRKALERDPPAIVVEAPAEPDPELARAVAEARAGGVPVVVFGPPLGAPTGDGPGREIRVAPEPFGPPAARIVEAAMRNAAAGKLDPKSGALILFDPKADALVSERVEALRKALADAGVAEIHVEPNVAEARFVELLAAHPKVTLVLTADASGFATAEAAYKADRPYVMAGFSAEESSGKSYVQTGEFAALGVYVPDRLVRKALSAASHALRGDKVADRVEVETPVITSAPNSGLPRGPIPPPPSLPE